LKPAYREKEGQLNRPAKATPHILDPSDIDEIDEVDGDERLVLIWCSAHRAYEWHWVSWDAEE
jgi:hypothetical protein